MLPILRTNRRSRISSLKKVPAVNREIVFALLLGFDLGITFMNIPPALQTLMGVYGVSYVTISVLIGTLFWSHALMQMPAGLITDRAGIKRTLVMSLFCVSVREPSSCFVSRHWDWPSSGRMIIGVGSGLGICNNHEDGCAARTRREGGRLPGLFCRVLLFRKHPGVSDHSTSGEMGLALDLHPARRGERAPIPSAGEAAVKGNFLRSFQAPLPGSGCAHQGRVGAGCVSRPLLRFADRPGHVASFDPVRGLEPG